MTEQLEAAYGDPTHAPFWAGAARRELLVQRCTRCERWQFYGRPFCIACGGAVEWVRAAGTGVVHSFTVVRVKVIDGLEPPYVVGLIELDEGPRLLSNVVGDGCAIGKRVTLAWRERPDAPPLLIFEIAAGG